MQKLLEDPKKNAKSIRDLRGWIKIQGGWKKYARKFGKSLPIVGAGVSLLFFAQNAKAQGIPRAVGDSIPVLADFLDIQDELDAGIARADIAINANIRHGQQKAKEAVLAWAAYELENRECRNPDMQGIATAIKRFYQRLAFAYSTEITVIVKRKWWGGHDIILQRNGDADITQIALDFQRELDKACGCRK